MVTLVNLTGDISDLIGSDFDARRTKVWIETNVTEGVIIDATGNTMRLGDATATVSATGTFTFTGLWATNSATNPTSFQYRVWIDYALRHPGGGRDKWDSGWFSLTATADLADVAEEQYVPPSWMTTATQTLQTYVDDAQAAELAAEAARDAAIDISNISTSDAVVEALVKNTGGAGPLTSTALSAAYAKRYTRIDVVADHGADNTGATSAVTAVNAALAAANTAGGCEIYFPPGTYDLNAGGLTAITADNVFVVGAGRRLTTINFKTGSLFKWGPSGNVRGGGANDIRFYCATTPDTDSLLLEVVTGSRQTFKHLFTDNAHKVFRAGYGTSYGCSQPLIYDINGYTYNQNGSIAFDFCSGAALTMRDVVIYSNCGFPTNATDPHPAATTTGIRFGVGAWDTFVLHNIDLNRYDIDLDISTLAAVNVANGWVTDCVFDYAKTNAVRLYPTTGGASRSIFFEGCWGVATDGHSWLIDTSAGVMWHIHFTDCVGRQSGKNNWRFIGGSAQHIEVLNCKGIGANRLAATNTGSEQDDLVLWSSGVRITGGAFGEDGSPYVGFTNQCRYGINRAADLNVQVTGVEATGVTGAWSSPTDTVADFRRLITNNRRLSNARPEYATTAAVTAPTSGAVQTNLTGWRQTLYIYGGTMTQAQHNGSQVAGAGPVTLVLNPGDTWQVNYTVAPTIMRVIHP